MTGETSPGSFRPAARLEPGATVSLYGAGGTGRRVLAALREKGYGVRCFLDTAAASLGTVSGIPVRDPFGDDMAGDERDLPVVITVFNRDADVVDIAERLRASGYGACFSYLDLHSTLHESLGDHFWLGARGLVGSDASVIASVEPLWEDVTSRRVFHALVSLYQHRDPRMGPRPGPRHEEYLPGDVAGWLPSVPLRLVDCGAYDGDTLEQLRHSGRTIEAAACFEPDPENYRKLRQRVSSWPLADRLGISLWPCGVSESTGTFTFASGLGEASRLAVSIGGTPVTCVALDDALVGFAPNLVKMDVEGAEEDALRGMVRLAREHRPALAISLYHRPADLWRLPAQIQAWDLDYRLSLRSYGFNGFDTICFAVPRSPAS